MDKQKQIEEMAKVIINSQVERCGECYTCEYEKYSKNGDCIDYKRAEALYNAGYCKIPENAVVLTREEYEKLQKGVNHYNYTAMFDAQSAYRWEQGYLQGIKETTEKFAERLNREDCSIPIKDDFIIVTRKSVDKICKEITEGGNYVRIGKFE